VMAVDLIKSTVLQLERCLYKYGYVPRKPSYYDHKGFDKIRREKVLVEINDWCAVDIYSIEGNTYYGCVKFRKVGDEWELYNHKGWLKIKEHVFQMEEALRLVTEYSPTGIDHVFERAEKERKAAYARLMGARRTTLPQPKYRRKKVAGPKFERCVINQMMADEAARKPVVIESKDSDYKV